MSAILPCLLRAAAVVGLISGQMEKVQHLGNVLLKVAQGVVTAFKDGLLCACIAGGHVMPIEHFITLGNQCHEVFGVGQRADHQVAQFIDKFGREEKVRLWVMPAGLLADVAA
jgi:hypothetical protein